MRRAEQITDPVTYHGEGPVWSPSWGGLRWVDMLAGDLLTLRSDGSVDRMHVGDVAAFVRPRSNGGYVVAVERGIALAEAPDDVPTPLEPMWDDPTVRMNEGGCDPHGNLYAGGMAYDQRPGGAGLYRITPEGDVSVVLAQVTVSNGLDFSPEGDLAYYNDTATGTTDVFDMVDGELTGRRVFHSSDGTHADGLTVDSVGNIWVALNGAGRVRCYSPRGTVLEEIEVPVRLVTAVTLGGPDLTDLYITTSKENLDDPEPEAGALFHATVDVPGRPVLPYRG